jgi:hypothetical protein
MPIYTYVDPDTNDQWEELWSYASHKQFLADNPDIQQVIHAPNFVSGISGVTHKNDSGFNDMMSRIAAANPTSPLADKYGDKGIKASKTREAVNKAKAKMAS